MSGSVPDELEESAHDTTSSTRPVGKQATAPLSASASEASGVAAWSRTATSASASHLSSTPEDGAAPTLELPAGLRAAAMTLPSCTFTTPELERYPGPCSPRLAASLGFRSEGSQRTCKEMPVANKRAAMRLITWTKLPAELLPLLVAKVTTMESHSIKTRLPRLLDLRARRFIP
jgi:hypothetical protein